MFFLFLGSYFLSLAGFLLGRAAFEEKKELDSFLGKFIRAITIFVFVFLGYWFSRSWFILFVVFLFLVYLLSVRYVIFKDLHLILFFSSSFFLFYDVLKIPYFALLGVFVLFFENSVRKFVLKEQIYFVCLSVIWYFILSLVFMFGLKVLG